ncbi:MULTISPECIES: ABC transporter permease [Stomatobaculum]|jgi:oligopeptide ABC superfamily ATP binding cassette transporter, membrane protein|uniref:ABC transporter permease n=1 Tax=Stomatobaculum TaxID=1213720 RepID=UPI0027295520|nr:MULTISPECIES: ABC transporter permease [Stomatobaculum]WLD86348.1 ABC transporter permease [Stomatobaculum sp. F0698]
MKKYIIKRLLWSVVILGIVAFLLYVLMRSLPTSYLEQIARQKSQQPGSRTFEEWMQQLSATYGMDKGIIPGFVAWLSKAVRLDFGDSWKYTIPVTQKFVQVVSISFWISLIVMILEVVISIPLGIIAATKQYSMADNVISVVALAGISLPTFFLASLLKLIFAVNLKWFDLNGLVSRNHDFLSPAGQRWDIAMHLVLPIMTLTIASVGAYMRFIRTNMLEVLNSDYIRTARAKGLSERRVVFHHAFRNTLITLVTIWGSSLPALFSGAMITEQLFSIPGIGYTSYQAMVSGDIPFSMFYLVFIAILTLIGNLLTDILYAVVDPRVRIA